jgi:hypothetical protein
MTVSRADLERLTPEDVARYLRGAGWLPTADLNGRATIWELDRQRLQVIVPVSSRFRDYPQRIYEVIRTLATTEDRPEPDIVASLTDAFVDRQYFRLFPDAPSGMIPAADAAEAFQGVRELLIAAAYSEHYPETRLVLPNSKPRAVREFPQRALLTTGPGSFVIAAHVKLPPDDETLFAGASFERRALTRLALAVLTAKEAAIESHQLAELTPFADRAQAGVSRTLCQGLSRLGGTGYRPFEVGFGWAGAAPTQLPDSTVRFETEQVAMLGHAAEDLGRTSLDERAEMRGKVRAMERNDPRDQGWVVVRGTLTTGNTSRQRQVWVPLDAGDYDRALRAHGQGLDVRLAGTLTRTGRRAELNPTDYFRVL